MRTLIGLFLGSVVATACLQAQTTTWTSFEDRAGHAIAADPQGGVMMFGGESLRNAGTLLNDTNRLNAANTAWSRETHATSPTARRGHAMVAAERQGQPVYIVFGGISQTGQVADTWVNLGGVWGPRGQGTVPTARTGHGMVTDFLRNEVYLIGGLSGALPRNDVYRYDPNTEAWTLRLANSPSGSVPSQRRNHSLAYDPGIDRVILFGGQGFAGTLNDTWAYDPTSNTWANLNPTNSPPPRGEGAMTYLLGFGVVLFGGKNPALPVGQQVLGDTWVFQGGNWTQPTNLPTSPPARFGHAMSPDQSATNVVLLGGSDASGAPIPGTWLWNGSQWSEQLPAPSRREGAAMAYDSTRGKHVVFGGRAVANGTDLDETWELEGLNWRKKLPSARPSPRSDAGMAFDAARNKTVLYGGRLANGQELSDTWEWNGSAASGSWSLMNPNASPPAAGGTQPVYDTARNKTWMLVGSDMWSFDGATWTMGLAPRPSPRASVAHAWDSARSRLVLFGGVDPSLSVSSDTWEWDGANWQQRFPITVPGTRHAAKAAYDPLRQQVVMFGGVVNLGNSTRYSEVWEWTGSQWNGGPLLTPLAGSGWAFDNNRAAIVLFGGSTATTWVDSMYQWNGAWSSPNPAVKPSPRNEHAMVFDPLRSRMVLFGGASAVFYNDTWEYDGTNWTEKFPSTTVPSPRAGMGAAFDSRTHNVLVFGGADNATHFNTTWTWNGTDWQQMNPSSSPSARQNPVCFSTGTRTILWGGSPEWLPQMWEWTGNNWVHIDSGKPSPRSHYGAAYDAHRDRVVVFGGQSVPGPGATYNNETWEWDGDSWLQRFPTNSPSARGWCKLTYDAARSRTVMFGGADATNTFQDTWEWDGNNWVQQNPISVPPGSLTHDITFDTARNVTVAFGSFGTWDYGPIHPASTASFPAIWPSPTTCTGSLGPIRIQTLPWSGPWLGDRFEVDFVNRPTNSLGLFLWAFSNTTWNNLPLPLPLSLLNVPSPCNLLVDPFVTELVLAPRYQSFLLPNDPILLSIPMFVQAGFFDNTPQGTQIVTTNGLELTFGRK